MPGARASVPRDIALQEGELLWHAFGRWVGGGSPRDHLETSSGVKVGSMEGLLWVDRENFKCLALLAEVNCKQMQAARRKFVVTF